LAGAALEPKRLAEIATAGEGHPDNVSACLEGGLVVCSVGDDGRVDFLRAPLRNPPLVVLASPRDFELSTERMRSALPQSVTHRDATSNVQRTALLVAALCAGERHLLGRAMEDRLHEPYRAVHVPGFDAVRRAAKGAGAVGVALSGSGPSVLAFAEDAQDSRVIGQAMVAAWDAYGIDAEARVLPIEMKGAQVCLDPPLDVERRRGPAGQLRTG
jgi:homoserine kinase